MGTQKSALNAGLLRLGAGMLGLAAVGVFVVQGSQAAFTANAETKENAVHSGMVSLAGNAAESTVFNVGNLNGGQTITRCVNVSYTGTLAADVKIHAKLAGTNNGLAPGLTTTIAMVDGQLAADNFDCAGFNAVPAPTALGTPKSLSAFTTDHMNFSHGIAAFSPAGGTNARVDKTFKITMTVSNDAAYQAKSAGATFTWEAQGKDSPTTNQ